MIILINYTKLIIMSLLLTGALYASEAFEEYKLDVLIKPDTNISFKSSSAVLGIPVTS